MTFPSCRVWRAYPGRALHGVGQTRVNDVLLRRSLKPQSGAYTPEEEEETVLEYYEYVCTHGDPSLELRGGDDGDGAAVFAELPLQTLLDRHCRETRALLTTKIRALVGGFLSGCSDSLSR